MAISEWRHPTLADAGFSGPIRCRCSRVRLATEMLDVAGIPAAKGAMGLCGPCVEDLHRKGELDRLELPRAKGAPQDWLEWWEAKLLAGPLLRSGLPQHVWGEILATHLDAAAEKASLKAEAEAAAKPAPDPIALLTARLEVLEAKVDGLRPG